MLLIQHTQHRRNEKPPCGIFQNLLFQNALRQNALAVKSKSKNVQSKNADFKGNNRTAHLLAQTSVRQTVFVKTSI